ncbi:hypothetical protein Y032_0485g2326 [Ancylostoma ceylanicum]|uniref:Uncharacterized protein n=1 Tax=Ancylostoma ceylanicum TaxID=53326 RepID=A0A016WV24_9BILA|nr:hypothetical protein Y032_0485g2326 [Ancylostoma ceylanicum]
MYSIQTEIRPLTILEWLFIFIVIFFGIVSILLGCYFTFMTRHGKSRTFEERAAEHERDSSEGAYEDTGGTMTSSSYVLSQDDTANVGVSSATRLIPLTSYTLTSSRHSSAHQNHTKGSDESTTA